jgi:hypothetical protein
LPNYYSVRGDRLSAVFGRGVMTERASGSNESTATRPLSVPTLIRLHDRIAAKVTTAKKRAGS